MDYKQLNGLTLAYLGDSYYELRIREYVLNKNYTKVNDLHQLTVKYVSAVAQSKIIEQFKQNDILTDEELAIVQRGRNSKTNHQRHNVDPKTYRESTSFEALIGYLYLDGAFERLNQLIEAAIKIIENGDR